MVHYNDQLKNGQCLPCNGRGPAKHSSRKLRSLKPREDCEYDPSVLYERAGRSGLPPFNGIGPGAAKDALGGKRDPTTPPAATKATDESFLVAGNETDAGPAPVDAGDGGWFKSEAFRLVSRKGSKDLPGNFAIGVPQWCLWFFQDIELAAIFAQILYWFMRGEDGTIRVRRRDGEHRPVIDKTHRQLADELGLCNERRVEKALKVFKGKGLLDYDPRYGTGKGRTTRIWLNPEGIQRAYLAGCERIDEGLHDKTGGS